MQNISFGCVHLMEVEGYVVPNKVNARHRKNCQKVVGKENMARLCFPFINTVTLTNAEKRHKITVITTFGLLHPDCVSQAKAKQFPMKIFKRYHNSQICHLLRYGAYSI